MVSYLNIKQEKNLHCDLNYFKDLAFKLLLNCLKESISYLVSTLYKCFYTGLFIHKMLKVLRILYVKNLWNATKNLKYA